MKITFNQFDQYGRKLNNEKIVEVEEQIMQPFYMKEVYVLQPTEVSENEKKISHIISAPLNSLLIGFEEGKKEQYINSLTNAKYELPAEKNKISIAFENNEFRHIYFLNQAQKDENKKVLGIDIPNFLFKELTFDNDSVSVITVCKTNPILKRCLINQITDKLGNTFFDEDYIYLSEEKQNLIGYKKIRRVYSIRTK